MVVVRIKWNEMLCGSPDLFEEGSQGFLRGHHGSQGQKPQYLDLLLQLQVQFDNMKNWLQRSQMLH